MLNKREIRRTISILREELEIREKNKMDKIIENKLLNSRLYLEAEKIFIYVSMKNEVNTKSIIKNALEKGKKIYVPKVDKENRRMKVIELRKFNELQEVPPFNILEPKYDCFEADSEELDLVIVPGVAFTEKGERIGYGGGYYDRFLNQYKELYTIALAYDFQILDKIPIEKHDERVKCIITDKRNIVI